MEITGTILMVEAQTADLILQVMTPLSTFITCLQVLRIFLPFSNRRAVFYFAYTFK